MPIRLNSFGGGSVTVDVPSTASNFTANLPAVNGNLVSTGSSAVVSQGMLAAGVATTGPAFSGTRNGQSINNTTFVKITSFTEDFDTANAFNATTGVFAPTIAGYYQFNFQFSTNQTSGSLFCDLRKNNNRVAISTIGVQVTGVGAVASGSGLIFLNGTTDIIELFGYQNSGGTVTTFVETLFSGFLARAA